MGVNLSIKSFVIIFISIIVLIAGVVLIAKTSQITDILDDLPRPFEQPGVLVKVIPQSAQVGTQFLINSYHPQPLQRQDLNLIIKQGSASYAIILYDDGQHMDNEPNDGVFGGFFNSEDKSLGQYEITDTNKTFATFTVFKPGCEIIKTNKQKESIDFVILSQEYENYANFKQDAEKIISGSNSITEIEPFKSNQDLLSFTLVNTTENLGCEINCQDIQGLVCCNDKKVIEQASQCNYDHIFILINSNQACGSASTYAKVCAKDSDAKLVLVHELGHSFADLADEYVYEDYDIGEIDNVNCAAEGCEKWAPITSNCIPGCTYSNLFRSSPNSIMYDLSPFFNDVSKNHIQNLINNHIQIERSTYVAQLSPKSYSINLRYDRGRIEIRDIHLRPIKAPTNPKQSNYSATIKDSNNQILFSQNLSIKPTIQTYPGTGHPIIQDSFEMPVLIPYYPDAARLEIRENKKTVQTISVSSLSNTCGDSECQESENHLSCEIDCEIGEDNFCQSTGEDPDCGQRQQGASQIWRILSFVLIAIGIISVITVVWNARDKVVKKIDYFKAYRK